jgi:hypothetical protein
LAGTVIILDALVLTSHAAGRLEHRPLNPGGRVTYFAAASDGPAGVAERMKPRWPHLATGAELRLRFGPLALSLSESSRSTTGKAKVRSRLEEKTALSSRGPVPLEDSLLLGAKSEVDARGETQVILVIVVS